MAVDPNIKKKADDIRNKIYGKEVRESLASGLEAISSDVVENTDRQDNVESQFQDVIDNTTDKDVISAPEIIAARNGESNLKARLDKENQEVTAQLAQKANETTNKTVLQVDGINGDDETGNGLDTPFKTIQKAIDTLPTIIKNHVEIKIADGIYTEQNEGYSGAHVDTIGTHMSKANIVFQNKHIHEGASITLIGNENEPRNVVLDGQGEVNNAFIMDMRRVNLKGMTFKNPATYNVQYKRYASGQLKNCIIDGGQFGLWAYQYCFIEVQNGVIFRNHDVAIYPQVQSYFNGVGITVENSVRVGISVGQNSSASFSQTNNYFNASESNFLISANCSIGATNMKITGPIGKVNGGFLTMDNSTVSHTGRGTIALEVQRTGGARLINVTIESTTPPANTTHSGITVKEGSRLMMVGGSVKGFYHNVSITQASSAFLDNVDIANALHDGLYVTDSQVAVSNLSSSIPNGRNGARFIRSVYVPNGLKGVAADNNTEESIRTFLRFYDNNKPTENLYAGILGFNLTTAKLMVYTGAGVGWVNVG